jgi:hypothetical protein
MERPRFALNVLFVTSPVTNWMTATGIALIAGGLATLICFRRVLWAGRGPGKAGTKRRPTGTVLPAQPGAPDISGAHSTAATPSQPASHSEAPSLSGVTGADRDRDQERTGLASIGLADEDYVESEEDVSAPHSVMNDVDVSNAGISDMDDLDAEASSPAAKPRSDEEFDLPTGDYWMPVPESAYADLDAPGYGWRARGTRDPHVESEPTAVVPTWPPARPFDRIELPRTWSEGSSRRTSARRLDDIDRNESRPRRYPINDEVADQYWDQQDRDGRDGWRRRNSGPHEERLTLRAAGPDEERLTLRAAERPRRPRPRPNPTVYVSRHAAE